MAIELTGLFTGGGTVVQVKDEAMSRAEPRGNADASCAWTGPLLVVTNKFSASAAEILSGAIKDYKRGLIIGDSTSHGKGSVQTVDDVGERLVPGSNLGSGKITIQGYYLPSGISPQGGGVNADIVLPSLSDVMEGVMESDLDNALTLRRVEIAQNFTPKNYVSPQIIAELKRRSEKRVSESKEFEKQMEKIAAIKEDISKRSIPLNEVTYMEEFKRFDTEEWEQEELEELVSKEPKIKRDFYVDEVLALATDYVKVTQEMGVVFPKERAIYQQLPRRNWFGF
jgi:carboxyl-terminal processing protease